MPPQHVAVLGAGITGLTSAFYLARRFPSTKITLIEGSGRVGGWVKSQRLQLPDGQRVLLEAGPRTLRPQSKALLELIHLLQLEGAVLRTFNDSPAARNRFLYFPGNKGLTLLPSSMTSLLTSRLTPVLLFAAARDLLHSNNLPAGVTDESVDSFLSRRFGHRFAEELGSALVHGIYAADSRKLSVRAAFPSLWNAHLRGGGSVVRSMLKRPLRAPTTPEQYCLGAMPSFMKDVAAFSFRHGIGQLVESLRMRLASMENVEIVHSSAKRLELSHDHFQISMDTGQLTPSHVVSALPLPALSQMIDGNLALPHLSDSSFSSVTVVNLIFDKPHEAIHPPGFGYLVPRTKERRDGLEGCIIGTVFDSAAISGQEKAITPLTKLTVMLGGPHQVPQDINLNDLVSCLEKHLGRNLPMPVGSLVHRNKDCIPVPGVGHLGRIAELRALLGAEPWRGRLEIVGASVDGVSVSDCIEAGRRVGEAWT